MHQLGSEDSYNSPSFSSYSSGNLTDVANKVTGECVSQQTIWETDDEFEFVTFNCTPNAGLTLAGEVFSDGSIGGVFPVFNRDILAEDSGSNDDASATRVPLKKLFLQDRDRDSAASSSSEGDELEKVPAGTYCVWAPKSPELSPGRCKKSNSTGSSASESMTKKWRLRDLLRRSKSDGKQAFVLLTPKSREKEVEREVKKEKVMKKKVVSPHEAFYVKKKEEEKRRRSYLPYRQDLLGFFGTGRVGPSLRLHDSDP